MKYGFSKYQMPEQEVIKLYKSGASLYMIGRHYKVSHDAVMRLLMRHGVPLRTRAEAHRMRRAPRCAHCGQPIFSARERTG